MLPPDIMGLTDEQVEELKLKDEWADKCVPMGGWTFNRDKIGTCNTLFAGIIIGFTRKAEILSS